MYEFVFLPINQKNKPLQSVCDVIKIDMTQIVIFYAEREKTVLLKKS